MSGHEDILPPNAAALERAISQAIYSASNVPIIVREMWSPDTCPAAHLPWLAWANSVDDWDAAWPDTQKRAVIRASYIVHRYKGTIGSMRAALGAVGYAITVREWFQDTPQGQPYTFSLTAESPAGEPITNALWDELISVANNAKNTRSHLTYARINSSARCQFYIGGAVMAHETVTIRAL